MRGATTTCSRSPARASAGEKALRDRLDRYLDRRIPHCRVRPYAVAADIARLEPGEIIVSDALYGDPEFAPYLRSLPAVTPLTRDVFDGASAERRLAGISLSTTEGFGALAARAAAAACITYVERTARPAPATLAAGARAARRDAPDRPGDAQQPRAGAHPVGRAPRIAARRDRPQRDRGGLETARATAGRAAHRCRRHRTPA